MFVCSGMALVLTFGVAIMTLGLRPRAIMATLGPIPGLFHYKQSITFNYSKRKLANLLVKQDVMPIGQFYILAYDERLLGVVKLGSKRRT